MRSMTTNTISLTATEAVGFVTLTCAVTLDGVYTYDIVIHADENHRGNAHGLSFSEAVEYLDMLFSAVCYHDLRLLVPDVLARITTAVGGPTL